MPKYPPNPLVQQILKGRETYTPLCLIFICCLLLSGCGDNVNKANILPPDVQYMADTMFSHRKRDLEKELDSLCTERFDALVAIKRDSLVLLQKEMIKKITGER